MFTHSAPPSSNCPASRLPARDLHSYQYVPQDADTVPSDDYDRARLPPLQVNTSGASLHSASMAACAMPAHPSTFPHTAVIPQAIAMPPRDTQSVPQQNFNHQRHRSMSHAVNNLQPRARDHSQSAIKAKPIISKPGPDATAPYLQIRAGISTSQPSLPDLAAQLTCLFWFGDIISLNLVENYGGSLAAQSSIGLAPETFPSQGFRKWVTTILSMTQVAQNVVLLALLFILRLKRQSPGVKGKAGSEFRILTVALMLGNKFLDDSTYTNKTWADVSGISVQEIHDMEVEFLSNMRYQLYASKHEWDQWQLKLNRFSTYYDQISMLPSLSSSLPTLAIIPPSQPFSLEDVNLASPPFSQQGSPATASTACHLDGASMPRPQMLFLPPPPPTPLSATVQAPIAPVTPGAQFYPPPGFLIPSSSQLSPLSEPQESSALHRTRKRALNIEATESKAKRSTRTFPGIEIPSSTAKRISGETMHVTQNDASEAPVFDRTEDDLQLRSESVVSSSLPFQSDRMSRQHSRSGPESFSSTPTEPHARHGERLGASTSVRPYPSSSQLPFQNRPTARATEDSTSRTTGTHPNMPLNGSGASFSRGRVPQMQPIPYLYTVPCLPGRITHAVPMETQTWDSYPLAPDQSALTRHHLQAHQGRDSRPQMQDRASAPPIQQNAVTPLEMLHGNTRRHGLDKGSNTTPSTSNFVPTGSATQRQGVDCQSIKTRPSSARLSQMINTTSPYRPMRGVNTLLVPPTALPSVQRAPHCLSYDQMRYQSLGRPPSERHAGVLPLHSFSTWSDKGHQLQHELPPPPSS